MSTRPLDSELQVLSTMNEDGSRRWLKPRVSKGRFLTGRRVAAYVLIVIFTAIPYLQLNGKPLVLLDIVKRQFTILGFTFLPTDTLLLALFVVGLIVSIFLITALFGRVWCGWACPQTVYMEFVYRPLERLFEGPPGRRHISGRKHGGLRRTAKYAVYLLVSMYLAHTFLAYFVGVDALAQWVRRSPFEHPVSFVVMLATTGLMMFDFCYFREQTCIVACPYGRLQSVMHDRHSMIISYDPARGEPRQRGLAGRPDRREAGQARVGDPAEAGAPGGAGDCVDCGLCVITCPTGIDIRNGLQMECIGCAQCIDACDYVMEKIDRPKGLIRYSSQAGIDGESKRLVRPRVVLYPLLLGAVGAIFLAVFLNKQDTDVTVLRGVGVPFTVLEDGRVSNPLQVKITNRSDAVQEYSIQLLNEPGGEVSADELPVAVAPGEASTARLHVVLPRERFSAGRHDVRLQIFDANGFSKEVTFRMLGPAGGGNTEYRIKEIQRGAATGAAVETSPVLQDCCVPFRFISAPLTHRAVFPIPVFCIPDVPRRCSPEPALTSLRQSVLRETNA